MLQALVKKLINMIPTLFGVSVLAFILIRLIPGDPVMLLIGERGASPEVYQEMNERLGLDKPLITQYFLFVKNALSGNLGTSIISKQPVFKEFMARFPATLELGMMSMVWAILFGIPMGILAATKRNSFWDFSLMGGSLVGYSMPIFWWALILIIIFSVNLGLTPVSGRIGVLYEIPTITGFLFIDSFFSDDIFGALKSTFHHIFLPSIVLGTIPIAIIARMTRSSLIEVLGEDFIRTAKAKGLSKKKVVTKHAFQNALIPIITVVGLMFGSIITGAILTETIFSWPGIGKWILNSVTSRDYPVIQGGVLLIASIIILINIIVDFAYILVNPKLRS